MTFLTFKHRFFAHRFCEKLVKLSAPSIFFLPKIQHRNFFLPTAQISPNFSAKVPQPELTEKFGQSQKSVGFIKGLVMES